MSTQLNALRSLDEFAREEIATCLETVARQAEDLMIHAFLPVTSDMLRRRKALCSAAADALRNLDT